MIVELKDDERIDDLQLNGLKIIQNSKGFCFGIDSILLSEYAKDMKANANVIDLGTGTGIISILLCGKSKIKKIIGVEIQKDVYDMVKRSIELNNLQSKFEVINDNINNLKRIYQPNSFDAIVTNPPYKKENTGLKNINQNKVISKHEVKANLEDFITISNYLLKDRGEFYMVHRPERLVDILSLMRKYKIEPKKIRFVCPDIKKAPNLVLIKGIKNGGNFLKIEKNLYIYDNEGNYTEEILNIYSKSKGDKKW